MKGNAISIDPIALCVQWVLPDVKLCSSCFTTAKVAATKRQLSPEAALCVGAEITPQVKPWCKFPSDLGSWEAAFYTSSFFLPCSTFSVT